MTKDTSGRSLSAALRRARIRPDRFPLLRDAIAGSAAGAGTVVAQYISGCSVDVIGPLFLPSDTMNSKDYLLGGGQCSDGTGYVVAVDCRSANVIPEFALGCPMSSEHAELPMVLSELQFVILARVAGGVANEVLGMMASINSRTWQIQEHLELKRLDPGDHRRSQTYCLAEVCIEFGNGQEARILAGVEASAVSELCDRTALAGIGNIDPSNGDWSVLEDVSIEIDISVGTISLDVSTFSNLAANHRFAVAAPASGECELLANSAPAFRCRIGQQHGRAAARILG